MSSCHYLDSLINILLKKLLNIINKKISFSKLGTTLGDKLSINLQRLSTLDDRLMGSNYIVPRKQWKMIHFKRLCKGGRHTKQVTYFLISTYPKD
jgi:hypothetical protein